MHIYIDVYVITLWEHDGATEQYFLQNISGGCLCRIDKLHNCIEEICLRNFSCINRSVGNN